jgi:hypothetical protein
MFLSGDRTWWGDWYPWLKEPVGDWYPRLNELVGNWYPVNGNGTDLCVIFGLSFVVVIEKKGGIITEFN